MNSDRTVANPVYPVVVDKDVDVTMRDGARLKADACCAYCRKAIGHSYVREIGNKRAYCDYDCYRSAIGAPLVTLAHHELPRSSWRLSS